MRVQISTLSVVVTQADSRAKCNIGRYIGHSLGVEGRLELRGHESISIARVDEADEVDGEHGHVEGHWDDDETEDPREEVLEPNADGDIACIAQENPELEGGQAADPGNGEEANPFDRNSSSQTDTSGRQPEPPRRPEGILWAKLILIDEGSPAERRQRRENDERTVEQNQATLRDQPILEHHQRSAQRRSESLTPRSLQRQKHRRHSQDATDRGQQPHGHKRHTRLQVILPDILEVEIPIEPRQPPGQCDQELRQWGVHVHEEFALDVLGREAAEVDLVEDDGGGLVDAEEADEEGEGGDGGEGLPVAGGEGEDVVVADAGGGVVVGGVGRFLR